MTNRHPEKDLPAFARQQLQQHANKLDDITGARLRAARKRALAATPARSQPLWLPAGLAASTVAALLALTLWQGEPLVNPDPLNGDWEQIATSDDLELIEQLEFYEWLESLEHSARPQQTNPTA